MVQTVSYSKLLTGLNFMDLLPICFKFRGSNLCHENHENLCTTKFNTLTVTGAGANFCNFFANVIFYCILHSI